MVAAASKRSSTRRADCFWLIFDRLFLLSVDLAVDLFDQSVWRGKIPAVLPPAEPPWGGCTSPDRGVRSLPPNALRCREAMPLCLWGADIPAPLPPALKSAFVGGWHLLTV
jgi:hypothetical protein